MDINERCEYLIKSAKTHPFVRKPSVVPGMMISINGFFLIPKTPIHLTFRSYYEIELNRIIKMYYSVEIPLKLESEPWSQQSSFDIRNGKPNVTSLLTKLGESRKKSSTISVNFI